MSATIPMDPATVMQQMNPPKRTRADGVSSNVKQHVVILRDHSSSMSGHKVDEANAGTRALIRELARGENKEGFFVTVIEFNEMATPLHQGEPASRLQTALRDSTASGGTEITAALAEAVRAIDAFAKAPDRGYYYLRPVTILFSDGQSSVDDAVLVELKERSLVVTAAYGSDADHRLLERIATSPEHSYSCGSDGDELRRFLAQVGATVSRSVAQNQDLQQTLMTV